MIYFSKSVSGVVRLMIENRPVGVPGKEKCRACIRVPSAFGRAYRSPAPGPAEKSKKPECPGSTYPDTG